MEITVTHARTHIERRGREGGERESKFFYNNKFYDLKQLLLSVEIYNFGRVLIIFNNFFLTFIYFYDLFS